jgi:hypothetical protein
MKRAAEKVSAARVRGTVLYGSRQRATLTQPGAESVVWRRMR